MPKSLARLTQLRELHLNHNELTKKSFSEVELQHTSLASLAVASNKLLSFPYVFTQCPS